MKEVHLSKRMPIFLGLLVINFLCVSVCWSDGGPREGCDSIAVEEPLFGDAEKFGTVTVVNSCESTSIIKYCGCSANGEIWWCETLNFDALPYLGSEPDIDWGKQGANVVVSKCGSVIPARGTIKEGEDQEIHEEETWYCGDGKYTVTLETTAVVSDSHYYKAAFDPCIFVVGGCDESPCLVGSPISVTLVNSDCGTLRKAVDAKVRIYTQKLQSSWMNVPCGNEDYMEACDTEDESCDYVQKEELAGARLLGTVDVVFAGMDMDEICPAPGSPSGGGGEGGGGDGGGCGGSGDIKTLAVQGAFVATGDKGCGGGGGCGDIKTLAVKSAFVATGDKGCGGGGKRRVTIDMILPFYGSPGLVDGTYDYEDISELDGTPEINLGGVWLRAEHYPYQGTEPVLTFTYNGGAVTKVEYSFEVTASGYKYYYSYDLEGNWASESLARKAFLENSSGKIPCRYVKRVDDTKLLEFTYDSNRNLIRQTSYKSDGTTVDGYIVYTHDNSLEFGTSLSRCWGGTNLGDASVNPPSGGRWIYVDFTEDGTLSSIDYACSECKAKRLYTYGGPNNDLVTTISDDSGNVLVTNDYDIEGRQISYSLGDNVVKINEWLYDDFDPITGIGGNILLRKDYVDNTEYRAKVFFANDNGALVKEIHYHQLQSNPDILKGPYSVFKYYYEKNPTDGLMYVTEYPKGNKLRKYYDDNGSVIKEKWDHLVLPHAEYDYDYYYYDSSSDPTMRYALLKTGTNAYGATTSYTYEGFDTKTITEPAAGTGISGADQQVATYTYYNQGRVKLETRKDSTGANVQTLNEYDQDTGQLKKQTENYVEGDSTKWLVTEYEYNDYGEVKKITYPSGKILGKFYSNSGTLIAEAVYEDYGTNLAISATIYVYEDGELKTIKTAKMDESFTFTGTEGSVTWVSESYEYDDYGRRAAVIADAGGQNLRTEYTYNNQGEVVKVLKPDNRYKKTIRDGRGLVTKEITGIKIGAVENDKATTQYFYDLNGKMTKKIDPEGVAEIYQYDLRGRLIKSRKGK